MPVHTATSATGTAQVKVQGWSQRALYCSGQEVTVRQVVDSNPPQGRPSSYGIATTSSKANSLAWQKAVLQPVLDQTKQRLNPDNRVRTRDAAIQSANQQKGVPLREQRTQSNREASDGRLRMRKTRVARCASSGGTAHFSSAAYKQTVHNATLEPGLAQVCAHSR
jgi:hypothetical protein